MSMHDEFFDARTQLRAERAVLISRLMAEAERPKPPVDPDKNIWVHRPDDPR